MVLVHAFRIEAIYKINFGTAVVLHFTTYSLQDMIGIVIIISDCRYFGRVTLQLSFLGAVVIVVFTTTLRVTGALHMISLQNRLQYHGACPPQFLFGVKDGQPV